MNNKWDYIMKISQMGDHYGNLLVQMMTEYSVMNLYQIKYEQAKEFYERLLSDDLDD